MYQYSARVMSLLYTWMLFCASLCVFGMEELPFELQTSIASHVLKGNGCKDTLLNRITLLQQSEFISSNKLWSYVGYQSLACYKSCHPVASKHIPYASWIACSARERSVITHLCDTKETSFVTIWQNSTYTQYPECGRASLRPYEIKTVYDLPVSVVSKLTSHEHPLFIFQHSLDRQRLWADSCCIVNAIMRGDPYTIITNVMLPYMSMMVLGCGYEVYKVLPDGNIVEYKPDSHTIVYGHELWPHDSF